MRDWIGLFMFAALMLPTLGSLLHRVGHGEGDFSEFREDGRIAIETRRLGAELPLPYPPTARPLFMVMAMPPAPVATAGWWLLQVWMYWQSAVWIARRAVRASPGREWLAALAVIGLTLVGIVSDLTVGQLTALVLFCVTGAFELAARRRGLLGGLLLGVSLVVKPLPVLLLPYFALRRQWSVLAGAAACWVVLGPLLLATIFGWDQARGGWRHFGGRTAGPRSPWSFFATWADRPGEIETYRRSGLSLTLVRLLRPVDYDVGGKSVSVATIPAAGLMAIWLAVVGGLGAWAAWRAYRAQRDDGLATGAFAGFVGVMLLANPHFISYWLAFPMLPAAVSLGAIVRASSPRDRRMAAVVLAVWVVTLGLFAFPGCRAAGSVVVGITVPTVGALRLSRRSTSA